LQQRKRKGGGGRGSRGFLPRPIMATRKGGPPGANGPEFSAVVQTGARGFPAPNPGSPHTRARGPSETPARETWVVWVFGGPRGPPAGSEPRHPEKTGAKRRFVNPERFPGNRFPVGKSPFARIFTPTPRGGARARNRAGGWGAAGEVLKPAHERISDCGRQNQILPGVGSSPKTKIPGLFVEMGFEKCDIGGS